MFWVFGTYKYPCALENIYTHFSSDMLRCITVGPQSYLLYCWQHRSSLNILNTRPLWKTYCITWPSPFPPFFFHFHLRRKVPLNEQVSLTSIRSYYSPFLSWLVLRLSFLDGFCLWYSMVLLEHESKWFYIYIYVFAYMYFFFPP